MRAAANAGFCDLSRTDPAGVTVMTIDELKDMLSRRVAYLQQQKSHASNTGDILRVDALDREIQESQNTLSQLNTL